MLHASPFEKQDRAFTTSALSVSDLPAQRRERKTDAPDELMSRHGRRIGAIVRQLTRRGEPAALMQGALKRAYCVMESLEVRRHKFTASIGLYRLSDLSGKNPGGTSGPAALAKVMFTEPVEMESPAWREKIEKARASDAEFTPEFVSRVRKGVAKLLPSHREALILINKPAQTYGDVAAILGMSVERLKVRINRARAELRRKIENQTPYAAA